MEAAELHHRPPAIAASPAVTVNLTPMMRAATGDSGEDESVAALVGGKSLWTARVSARSKVRPNQPVELAVDTANLQFFDADSGLSIGHPNAHAAAAEPVSV